VNRSVTEIWHRIWHLGPVLTVGLVGVAVSISIWYLMIASESRAFGQEFAGRADNQIILLQNGVNDYWDKLYAVRALFDSSGRTIAREEFEDFSNSLLAGREAILNIAWIPRVKREERIAHELAAVRDGLLNYRIRVVASDFSLPASPERDEYFPKFYSTEARTSPVYGLDLKDGAARERTLARIRDGNVLAASPPLMLHIGLGDRRGFWAGVPVYARGLPHDTVEDRRSNLLGIIQGVFQIGVMFDTILAGVKTPVRLYLFAPDAAVGELPIYFRSRVGNGSIEPKAQAELAGGLHRSFSLDFGDVPWKVVVVPEPASLWSTTGHGRSSIVLLCGLLLSAGLTSFVWAMRRANERFGKQNLQFDAALNNMAQGLLMFNPAGKLIIFNRRVAELFGVPWEEWKAAALGTTVPQSMQLASDLTRTAIKNQMKLMAELQGILDSRRTGSIVLERTDGRSFSSSCSPMIDGGLVLTFDDITDRRRSEKLISHMAHHDALTDLLNRTLFYRKIDELLLRKPQSAAFAVLSMDLDRFKSVNDTLGHPIGDKLLQAVAERMRGCVRESDIVARLGGDEFAVVQVTFDGRAGAIALAARVIDAVRAPYQLDGHQITVGTSIGIAIAPRDGTVPDELMKKADLALYRCKADGGCAYRFFEPQMDARGQQRGAPEERDSLTSPDGQTDAAA
jgi:diguanylate cyclase (GGDEF)-like protein